jgi:hypothetical protein
VSVSFEPGVTTKWPVEHAECEKQRRSLAAVGASTSYSLALQTVRVAYTALFVAVALVVVYCVLASTTVT